MRHVLVCLFLGVLAVGCEKKEQGPAAPAAAAAPKVEAPAVPAAVAEGPKVQAPAVPAAVTEAPQAPGKVEVQTAPPAIADAAKPSAAPATAPSATTDAQSKLQLVMQYIKDKKFDLAEKILGELDAQKASLPASLQGQIATAQTALKAAKATSGASGAAGGITVPSLGK